MGQVTDVLNIQAEAQESCNPLCSVDYALFEVSPTITDQSHPCIIWGRYRTARARRGYCRGKWVFCYYC